MSPVEGSINIIEVGEKEIDRIFEKIVQAVEKSKIEMKERLREAYKANYKNMIDKKSQNYFTQLDLLEGYVNTCLVDWDRKMRKGKFVVVCAQKPKIEDLQKKIQKFEMAFVKMCEKAREYRDEFSIQFRQLDFENNFRELLNMHIPIQYPGLESGVFPVLKQLTLHKSSTNDSRHNQSMESDHKSLQMSSSEFDPIKSLEKEEYDIRRAKEYPKVVQKEKEEEEEKLQIKEKPMPIQLNSKYELKTLKFKRDKFELKIYDAMNKKGRSQEVPIPEDYKRIATKFFSYVSLGKEVIMCGGQFVEDKTCSIDTYKVYTDTGELEDLKSYMKVARMHHSMIFLEEKNCILAVGGEDENSNLLDSSEIYSLPNNHWKMYSTLNNKGKYIGLCKFQRDNKQTKAKQTWVYAFCRSAIERIDISLNEPKWEELKIKNQIDISLAPISFQFSDSLIVLCGGSDEKNSTCQDIIFFNPLYMAMEKSANTKLIACDKFTGGAMTQFVINRLESRIVFCSEAFVHEIEYAVKAGELRFESKTNLY